MEEKATPTGERGHVSFLFGMANHAAQVGQRCGRGSERWLGVLVDRDPRWVSPAWVTPHRSSIGWGQWLASSRKLLPPTYLALSMGEMHTHQSPYDRDYANAAIASRLAERIPCHGHEGALFSNTTFLVLQGFTRRCVVSRQSCFRSEASGRRLRSAGWRAAALLEGGLTGMHLEGVHCSLRISAEGSDLPGSNAGATATKFCGMSNDSTCCSIHARCSSSALSGHGSITIRDTWPTMTLHTGAFLAWQAAPFVRGQRAGTVAWPSRC